LIAIADQVVSGLNDREIAEINPVAILRYQKGIDSLRTAVAVPGRLGAEIDSVLYLGPSGTGKSHRLRLECPPGPDWFWVSPGKWFDGYQGQPGLVFDEFRGNWMPYNAFLKLVDIYPHKVERKGSVMEMRAFRFRFSSNEHPEDWWHGMNLGEWDGSPLQRRFTRIEGMFERYQAPLVHFDNTREWWALQPKPARGAARGLFGVRLED